MKRPYQNFCVYKKKEGSQKLIEDELDIPPSPWQIAGTAVIPREH